jgi:hypothetical protein
MQVYACSAKPSTVKWQNLPDCFLNGNAVSARIHGTQRTVTLQASAVLQVDGVDAIRHAYVEAETEKVDFGSQWVK